ncbi:hypothetical protein JTB14_026135 [Gonioctena quinquepunctata]|nr:hypothetical protein JTB14_026135 [Gonioctena quinquepunctata]
MLIIKFVLVLGICVRLSWGQMLPRRLRRFPPRLNLKTALGLRDRIQEKITRYRERTTQSICYETVGCFNLPHKNSPLQKVPEDPQLLDTKFYLLTRRMADLSKPEVLYYDDNGKSLNESTMDFKKPLKLIAHGYTSKWNEKGSLIIANTYLKLRNVTFIWAPSHIGLVGNEIADRAGRNAAEAEGVEAQILRADDMKMKYNSKIKRD